MSTVNIFDPGSETRRLDEPILRVRGLGVDFSVDGAWVMASEGVDFDIHPGEVLALVGESGSGKSVSAMSILGLLPANARVQRQRDTAGQGTDRRQGGRLCARSGARTSG